MEAKVLTPMPMVLRIVVLFLIGMALSMVLEAVMFSSQSMQSYPLAPVVSTWLMKHAIMGLLGVITAIILEWLWSQKQIVPLYENSKLALIIVLILASICYLQVTQWVPDYVRGGILIIGCHTFNCLLRFILYPFGVVMSAVVLSALWFLYRDPHFKKALLIGGILGAVIMLALLGQVAWQAQLNQQIPLQSAIVRAKTIRLSQGLPLVLSVYNQQKSPEALSDSQAIFNSRTDLAPFFIAGQDLNAQSWHKVCAMYSASSFGLKIYGAGVAQTCDYIGAVVYKKASLCDVTPYKKQCRADVAALAKDASICQGDPICLKNPLIQP